MKLPERSSAGNASTWFEQSVMCCRLQNYFTTTTLVVLVTARVLHCQTIHTHAYVLICLWRLLAAGHLAAGEACPKDREVVKEREGLQVPQTLSSWQILNGEQSLWLSNSRGNFFISEHSCQYPEQRKTVHQPGSMRALCTDREQ